MSDLAQLGFNMDTKGLVKGEKALDSFSAKGAKTEKKIGNLETGFKSFGRNASAAVASVDGPLGGISSRISSLTTVLTSGTGAITAFAVGVSAASFALIRGVSETEQLETNLFRLDALIKSTGKTSQVTSQQLYESARSLALSTLGSTEGIMDAQAIMLSFKAIAVESYDEVTEAALNVSAITKQDVVSSMSQLAKALEKPATGMSALSRSGITFTESQIALAKQLEENGDLMGAQRVILDELATSEGVAKAAAMGLSGAKDTLGQSVQELTINLNKSIGLNESLTEGYKGMADSIFSLSENTDSLVDAAKAFATVGGFALFGIMTKLAISTATTTASTIAYNIQLAKMAGFTGAYAVKAGIAATATRALGVATRFALGPWGLLITAVGFAASVFMSSKERADELTDSISLQKKEVEKLTLALESQGKVKMVSAYAEAQKEMIKIDSERYDIQTKLAEASKANSNSITGFKDVAEVVRLTKQMEELNERSLKVGTTITAVNDILENGLNAADWIDPIKQAEKEAAIARSLSENASKSYDSQMLSLKRLQEQIGLTSDELVIYNARQTATTNNYTKEQTKAVIAQAEAFVKARKEYSESQDTTKIDFIAEINTDSAQYSIESLRSKIENIKSLMVDGNINLNVGFSAITEANKEIEQYKKSISRVTASDWVSSFELKASGVDEAQKEIDGITTSDLVFKVSALGIDEIKDSMATISAGIDLGYIDTTTGQNALNELAVKLSEIQNKDAFSGIIGEITSETAIGQIDALNEKIALTRDLLDVGLIDDDIGKQYIDGLKDSIASLNTEKISNPFETVTDGAIEALSAVQGLSEQGSKDYAKLGVAIQAVTTAQKVAAIASQATMATITGGVGAVLALVSMVSTLGGDLEDTSAEAQALQGLSEWGEKADSIADSTEITASATDELVGINTSMLEALESLGDNIASAVGISIGDTSNADFSYSPDVMTNAFGSFTDTFVGKLLNINFFGLVTPVFDFIGGLLGGSSKVSDSGIEILGGAMVDILDGASVYAFQTVKSKKYAWSSTKTNTELSLLDDASSQFSLVFESLADAVAEGANALGYSASYITDAINEFEIETQKISLKGLSTEEQQEEIEAVFSEIFNGLAESVVPFIDEFQTTGEELGTTLTRLATQVSVAEYAAENLGFELGDKLADPYLFAQISDNLATMVGGVEDFASSVSSFIDNFATDELILDINANALTSALGDVGLYLPDTTSGFWELMQGLDGTTASGQEQIATLLSLTDTANDYYSLLENTQESMADLSDTFASAINSIYDVSDAVTQVSIDSAIAAARIGDFSLAENLNASGYALDASDFSSLSEYNVAQAVVANKLLELSELSAQEAGSVETDQLDQLKAINKSIIDSITETNGLLRMQNRYQASTSEYLDNINNKTEYAA